MNLPDLMALLDETPVIADIHPISCCYLPDDVWVTDSLAEVAWEIDNPTPSLLRRILITQSDRAYSGRFPHVHVEHDPFTSQLNEILFFRFDDIASRMLTQSQVGNRIIAEANDADVVILYLVDGLSYAQAKLAFSNQPSAPLLIRHSVEPCLVDAPTTTSMAFSNLIGDPSLATCFFEQGYHRRLGFSHWTRADNTLTDRLFQAIPRVEKVSDFADLLHMLRKQLYPGERMFVQILRTGLDGYAHRQKRHPPIEAIVSDIQSEFEQLVALCRETECSARLYLTADHGILWRDEFEPEVVGNAPSGANPRHCTWRDLHQQSEPGRRFVVGNEEIFCLGYPKLRRPLRIDEQGVHGGISFQESIVPFVSVHVNPLEQLPTEGELG